ncbi:MAG: sugar ABC transporter permease [Candidatus Limiplasma sp.]|nr:sugar ABC transporter permease [Candidatus Limiplasma sp.]
MNRRPSLYRGDNRFGMILVLPAIAVFCIIILYPFINSLILSFTNMNMLKPTHAFVGFKNFEKIFGDPNFMAVLKNTLIFVAGSVSLPFVLGFIWAIVLNEKFKLNGFLRGVTLIDWIIPSTAISFLWMWIFNGDYGVLNGVLRALHITDENINFLGRTDTAMLVVILARTWQVLPWYMAFLTGGLGGVSMDQAEAAKIDGANNWLIFRHVVVPAMMPIISLVLLQGTIGALQHFDLIWVMTAGGPARATMTLSVEVYQNAFKSWKIGLAASIGVVWIILLGIFSFFYIRRNMKEI